MLLIVLVLNLIAAAMVLEFEGGNPDANIASYPDALWWAVTTITTVGYGDRFPMSVDGGDAGCVPSGHRRTVPGRPADVSRDAHGQPWTGPDERYPSSCRPRPIPLLS